MGFGEPITSCVRWWSATKILGESFRRDTGNTLKPNTFGRDRYLIRNHLGLWSRQTNTASFLFALWWNPPVLPRKSSMLRLNWSIIKRQPTSRTFFVKLMDVLLRFRFHRIALIADVSRMHRAIELEKFTVLKDYRMTRPSASTG